MGAAPLGPISGAGEAACPHTGERYRLTGVVGSDQSARVFTAAPEAMEA